jgi:osmoprotectant transport system permease protein
LDIINDTLEYALDPKHEFLQALWTHLLLSGVALLIAACIGVPLGIFISRYGGLERVTINVAGFLRVVPSVIVLFLLLPPLGIGFKPAVIALALLAIPPLLINTDVGLRGVDPAVVEAGRGMGMSELGLLRRVELPLAMPVMVLGLRLATVEVIASAALASLIGGGGLGDFIASGLTLQRHDILLTGAIPVALLAFSAELALSSLQRRMKRNA